MAELSFLHGCQTIWKLSHLFSFFLNLLSEKQIIFLLCIKYLLFRNSFYWVLVPCAYVWFFLFECPSLSYPFSPRHREDQRHSPLWGPSESVHTSKFMGSNELCKHLVWCPSSRRYFFFFYHDTYNRTKTLMLTYYHKGNVILLSYCWFKSILLNNWVCYQEIKLYFLPCFKLLSKCE